MFDNETQAVELAQVESNGHAGSAASIWEALRERRERLAADRHFDLEVPGAGGMLMLRLGPISGKKQAQLTDRLQKSQSPERDFNLNADYLLSATQGLLGREQASGPWEELVGEDGEPLRFDHRLAEKLSLPEGTTSRELVRYVFGFAPSPEVALAMACGQYLAWAGAVGVELDEEYLGEA